MRLSLKNSLLLASLAFVLSVAGLVVTSGWKGSNDDAMEKSLSRLNAAFGAKAAKLIAEETAGLTRNEQGGIVYYHIWGKADPNNRVYLLWSLAGEDSQAYKAVKSALSKEKLGAAETVGVAVYVDLGFYTFRTKYDMMLSRAFRDMGLGGLRGGCYRWDDRLGSWAYRAELSNDVVVALLSPEQKRAILDGTYNMVSATDVKEAK